MSIPELLEVFDLSSSRRAYSGGVRVRLRLISCEGRTGRILYHTDSIATRVAADYPKYWVDRSLASAVSQRNQSGWQSRLAEAVNIEQIGCFLRLITQRSRVQIPPPQPVCRES